MSWNLVPGFIALLFGAHRLALWMEAKGRIYYQRKRARPDAAGNAFVELQQIVHPQAGHILKVKRTDRRRQQDIAGS